MTDARHPHHAHHTRHSHVHVTTRKMDHRQKKVAMLVIVGLYAASFRQNVLFREARDATPRWSAIESGIITGAAPYEDQLNGLSAIKNAVVGMVNAKTLQAKSIEIMKEKIQSATSTAALKN